MNEFCERLKELMEENNIKAEALSKNLNGQISANTIRAYAKGNHKPNSIENIKILANYFNVSMDYIQGFTNEKTTNVEVKNIYNTYGLSEKALKNLKEFNSIAKKNENFTYIKTINFILSQDLDYILRDYKKILQKNEKYKKFFDLMLRLDSDYFMNCEDEETHKLVDDLLKLESE